MSDVKRIIVEEGTPEDAETPMLSVRPVSPMHSWMHYLEAEVKLSEVLAVIESGCEPQWHAHSAERWAITVYQPDPRVYVYEGQEFPARGMMYYVMPDAVGQVPLEYRPKA